MSEHVWFPTERPRRFGHLRWPRLTHHRIVNPGTRVVLNRYPFSIIGVAIVVGDHCLSLVWGRPSNYDEVGKDHHLPQWVGTR